MYKVITRIFRTMFSACCGTTRLRSLYAALGIRHLQAVLLYFGVMLAYAMRVNMSMAIVAMTDPKTENNFNWSTQDQSVLLSSFFWGYIVLQVPGGELASRIGGKILLATSVGINSVLVLMIPWCAFYGGWRMVCACRVLQGLTQGVIFPSLHNLIAKWVPVEEKSRLGTFVYAGAQLGTAIQLTTSGFIAESFGWPMIFYSTGALSAIWTMVYICWGSSSPQHSKNITVEERMYIETSLGVVKRNVNNKTPWRSILTSGPFWALVVVHCGHNWGHWTLMTEIPTYMKKVIGVNIKSNGMLSALPYIGMYLLSFPCGFIVDYTLQRKWVSLTAARKISNSIGLYGSALAVLALSHATPDAITAATLLTVTVAISVGYMTGFLLVHIDMAPNYAGSMLGITNGVANIISIIAPLVAGAILKDDTDPEEWKVVFDLTAMVYIVTNTIFVIFGTSERQQWNNSDAPDIQPLISEKKIKS